MLMGNTFTYRALNFREPTRDDIDYVVRRMRKLDRREIYGARFDKTPEGLVVEFEAQASQAPWFYAIRHRDHPRPIALLSIVLFGPGHGYANLVATNEFPRIVRDLTRWVREQLIAACWPEMRRVELRTLASWKQNCRWLEALGAEFECLVPGMGFEPYAQYAWVNTGG